MSKRTIGSKRSLGVLLAAGAIGIAACGSSSGSSPTTTGASSHTTTGGPGSTGAASDTATASNPVAINANDKSVSFFVVAGQGGGLNFDGEQNGGLSLTVPVGWKVSISCRNEGNIPHSCVIVDGATALTPAFPGAATPGDPTTGFDPGITQSFNFSASTAGTYRIVCLVPSHEEGGMWANFTVSATASTAQLQTATTP